MGVGRAKWSLLPSLHTPLSCLLMANPSDFKEEILPKVEKLLCGKYERKRNFRAEIT